MMRRLRSWLSTSRQIVLGSCSDHNNNNNTTNNNNNNNNNDSNSTNNNDNNNNDNNNFTCSDHARSCMHTRRETTVMVVTVAAVADDTQHMSHNPSCLFQHTILPCETLCSHSLVKTRLPGVLPDPLDRTRTSTCTCMHAHVPRFRPAPQL